MNSQSGNPKRKPLVTVEFQTEIDVATGNREKRMFVKMYFDARDSGLLAALPDDLWKTLCCLATYVDENGNCYPSQAALGEALGISRQHINYRIKRLLAFRFHGEPILTVTKSRQAERGGQPMGKQRLPASTHHRTRYVRRGNKRHEPVKTREPGQKLYVTRR